MAKAFTNKDLIRIADLARQETGADVGEKQYPMLESRLSQRISRLGLADIKAYWLHFEKNEAEERRGILSLMTTHHTFFFREYVHFEALEKWVDANASRLKSRFSSGKTPLKIWSAACSRGHEVYSLAMFLEYACWEKHGIAFEILGSDLDPECVEEAKNGVYPIGEVNKIPQKYIHAFFSVGGGVAKGKAGLNAKIKSKTKFEVGNLLNLGKISHEQKFDVIFIRNVFIYFSVDQVQQIALSLRARLLPDGLFVTGVSEPIRFPAWDLMFVGPSVYTTKDASLAKVDTEEAPTSANATSLRDRPRNTKAASLDLSSVREITSVVPTGLTPAVVTQPMPSVQSTSYRVLCVDDSPTIQAMMKHIFSRDKNCTEFVSALNGLEARKKLDGAPEGSKYDIITLDIHMPVMGGLEFLETNYKSNIDPPVLMISSVNRQDVELATMAMSLGAADYIEKPAMNKLEQSSDEILAKIKIILKDRRELGVPPPSVTKVVQVSDPVERPVTDSTAAKYNFLPPVQIFNQALSHKILIPDASQCMRWIKMNASNLPELKYIIEDQKRERRSPALVISVPGAHVDKVMAHVLSWTKVKPEAFVTAKGFLRANLVYVCDEKLEATLVPEVVVKNFSLQILCAPKTSLECFGVFNRVDAKRPQQANQAFQVLLNESLRDSVAASLKQAKIEASDITPSTSFASLSLEFFASLRRIAS